MRALLFSCVLAILAGCGSAPPPAKPPAPPDPFSDEFKKSGPPAKLPPPCADTEEAVLGPEEIAGKKVRYVRYCGVADDKLEELDNVVHVKTGTPLDLEKLAADVRTQFAAGVFRRFDVVARRTQQADAVDIELHVQLSPYANSFTIEGAPSLPTDDPARKAIEPETTAPPAYVRRKADEVRDRYRAQGFEDVSIERVITPVPDQEDLVDITFKVTEGTRTKLGAISMIGVSKENDAELRRLPQLAPGTNLSGVNLGAMRKAVAEYYRGRGYLKFEGTVERGPREADFTAPLTVKVTEGSRYRVHDIKFDFDGATREATMRRLAKVRLGDFVDESRMRADAKNMTAVLEKSAPDLQVDFELIVDTGKPVVDVVFKERRSNR